MLYANEMYRGVQYVTGKLGGVYCKLYVYKVN